MHIFYCFRDITFFGRNSAFFAFYYISTAVLLNPSQGVLLNLGTKVNKGKDKGKGLDT